MLKTVKQHIKGFLQKNYSVYVTKNKNKFCGLSNLESVSLFIDIGANKGEFVPKLISLCNFRVRNLILVEPDKRYEVSLSKTKIEGVDKIEFVNACVSENNGRIPFHQFENGAVNSLLEGSVELGESNIIDVESITGSALMQKVDASVTSGECILKIDVQGAEEIVLKSFGALLKLFDYIIIEITFHDYYLGQSDFFGTISKLNSTHEYAGNLSETYRATGTIDYMNAVFRLRQDGKGNRR